MKKHHTICLFLLLPLLASLACSASRTRPPAKKPIPTAASMPQETVPTAPATLTPPPVPPTKAPSPPGDVHLEQVELDMVALQQIQDSVNQGHETWRLDPLQVAQAEGETLGFDPAQDVFDLLPTPDPTTGEANVMILHGEHLYIIHLTQPVQIGPGGIWIATNINRGL